MRRHQSPSNHLSVPLVATILGSLASLAVPSPGSAATVSVTASASVQGLAPDTHTQTSVYDMSTPGGLAIRNPSQSAAVGGSSGTDGGFTGSSSAAAAVASLHASAGATGFIRNASPVSDAGGEAAASWSDGYVISVPNGHVAGEIGSFHATAILGGNLEDSIFLRSYAQSTVVGTLTVNPQTGYNGGVTQVGHVADLAVGYDTGVRATGDQDFLFDITVPVTFGGTVFLSGALDVSTFVRVLGEGEEYARATSAANYDDTFRWLGAELFDAAGNVLTDWSAISPTSGFDYRYAAPEDSGPVSVPEPGMMFLFGAAFLSLQVARRVAGSSSGKAPTIADARPA